MREILFRGKRTDNGEWIEGSLIVLDADSGYYFITEPYKSASTLPVKDLIYNHTHLVDPETVCQYIGLTDKNGVKIFEGDICKSLDGVFLVFFEYERCGFVMKFNDYPGETLDMSEMWDDTEVIGNIFDNPELLEGGGSDE